jgi:hypothetical protein
MKIIIVTSENNPVLTKAFEAMINVSNVLNSPTEYENISSLAHVWVSLKRENKDIDTLNLFSVFANWDRYAPGSSSRAILYLYPSPGLDGNYFGFFGHEPKDAVDYISRTIRDFVDGYIKSIK